jgi:hypothetical protein
MPCPAVMADPWSSAAKLCKDGMNVLFFGIYIWKQQAMA